MIGNATLDFKAEGLRFESGCPDHLIRRRKPEFDKIARSDFGRPKADPQGTGQGRRRRNLPAPTNTYERSYGTFCTGFCTGSGRAVQRRLGGSGVRDTNRGKGGGLRGILESIWVHDHCAGAVHRRATCLPGTRSALLCASHALPAHRGSYKIKR